MPTVPRAGHERWVRSILNHDFASMPIYQFWFVAGAVVAAHYTSIRALLVRRPWFARACFSLTFVVLMVNYYMQRVILHNPIADDVLQPIPLHFVEVLYTADMNATRQVQPRLHGTHCG